jgi:hypothetical protein
LIKKLIISLVLSLSSLASGDLLDGSFESNDVYYGYGFLQGGVDTPWKTTAPDNLIEIWGEYMPTPAYEGTRHAELNANYASTLYQDVNGLGDNNSINWHFAHRGRYGTDVMKLTITDLGADQLLGGGDDTTIFTQNFAADDAAWQVHYGTITSIGNLTRFSFEAVSAVGGNTQGNFIDWCGFGPGVVIPCAGPVFLLGLAGYITPRRRNV